MDLVREVGVTVEEDNSCEDRSVVEKGAEAVELEEEGNQEDNGYDDRHDDDHDDDDVHDEDEDDDADLNGNKKRKKGTSST